MHLDVHNIGLVTSVGLSGPAACAAIRAKLTNPTTTRFCDPAGEWIMAHQVELDEPWRGRARLAKMAALAISDCMVDIPREDWRDIPLILCVAELERPGRVAGLEEKLYSEIQQELNAAFAPDSTIIARGRASLCRALAHARELLNLQRTRLVVIAAADSLLTSPTLGAYASSDRLLTPANSNGFMPGEGAGAVLVSLAAGHAGLSCVGIGFGTESAHIDAEAPLRADGLTQAIKNALAEAGCELHELDFRIVDVSGEQYYFKEAALALGRVLRQRKEEFDIWHPAECIGETGAVIGIAMLAVADAACRKGYAPGANILAHMSNDAGLRAAAVWRFGGVQHGQ